MRQSFAVVLFAVPLPCAAQGKQITLESLHDFLLHRNRLAAYTASFDFLSRKLVHTNAAH